LKCEGRLREKMGQVEVKDQVDGLEYLIEKGYIDKNRIGVTVWSYGGYLALLCLAQRPDIFKVAISGAPVTLWEAYDTGYTERYMNTKKNCPEAYEKGSVLTYAKGFPDQHNRLIILHGLIDENVHFCHTSELIHELVTRGKPYQLQVYPHARHGIRTTEGTLHMEETVLRFIIDNL